MNNKVKVNQIGEIIHAHPTLSEIILSLVDKEVGIIWI